MTRDELQSIRDLCQEHDAFLAQCRREAEARIVRKTHAPPPEPEPPPAAPSAPWRDDPVLIDAVADFVAQIIGEERERAQRELDSARAEMGKEISRVQGQVDTLLALVRPEPKPQKAGGEVADVPQLTWRN